MGVHYDGGEEIITIVISDSTGARIDKFVCNKNDDKQLAKNFRIMKYKYGVLENYDLIEKEAPKPEKKIIDF